MDDIFPRGDRVYSTAVSFDLETVTKRKVSQKGEAALAFIDQIAGEEIASRQNISIGVRADGRTDYVIIEKNATIDVMGGHRDNNLPNISPAVYKTVIVDGMIQLFDRSDNLLYEQLTTDIPTAITGVDRLLGRFDFSTYAQDGTVERLNEETYLIRKSVPESVDPSFVQKNMGWYTEEVVIEDLNLLLGCSLHKADGTVVSRTVFKYDYIEGLDRWLPEVSFYEELAINETTGSHYALQTTTHYQNFTITTN